MVRRIGKHLFPNATRSERKKYTRGAIYWFITSVVIVSAIAALEWFMYLHTVH